MCVSVCVCVYVCMCVRVCIQVTAIKRLVEDKKKRQGKLQELTAGTGGLSGGGSRFGHSALMESIERFEKMTFSDFCDDLEDEEEVYQEDGQFLLGILISFACKLLEFDIYKRYIIYCRR